MTALDDIRRRIAAAAPGRTVRLLAVSKLKPADAVRELASLGQHAFGENYVQEGVRKITELAGLGLEWQLIGPLQSNKCREVAESFDGIESLDRLKLVEPLGRFRPAGRPPLRVLVQVNIDDETSKSGAKPAEVPALCDAVAKQPGLELRGLMAIPAPHPDLDLRRTAFRRMRELFDTVKLDHPGIDTLSMGMSEDFELAIAEGATEVRIGSALFGARG